MKLRVRRRDLANLSPSGPAVRVLLAECSRCSRRVPYRYEALQAHAEACR